MPVEKMKLWSLLGLPPQGRATPRINLTHGGKQTEAERWKAWVLEMSFELLDQAAPDFYLSQESANIFCNGPASKGFRLFRSYCLSQLLIFAIAKIQSHR